MPAENHSLPWLVTGSLLRLGGRTVWFDLSTRSTSLPTTRGRHCAGTNFDLHVDNDGKNKCKRPRIIGAFCRLVRHPTVAVEAFDYTDPCSQGVWTSSGRPTEPQAAKKEKSNPRKEPEMEGNDRTTKPIANDSSCPQCTQLRLPQPQCLVEFRIQLYVLQAGPAADGSALDW